MSEKETPDQPKGQEAGGLGFAKLSMNEIAPAMTSESAGGEGRSGRVWLIIVAVLVVLAGAGWFIRNHLDLPPSEEIQTRVTQEVKALGYSQRGQILDVAFTGGGTLRVSFASDLNTQDLAARNTIRRGLHAVLNAAVTALPHRDLTVLAFQGDRQIGDAKYFAGAMKAKNEVEMVIHVENGDGDSVSDLATRNTGGPGAPE